MIAYQIIACEQGAAVPIRKYVPRLVGLKGEGEVEV